MAVQWLCYRSTHFSASSNTSQISSRIKSGIRMTHYALFKTCTKAFSWPGNIMRLMQPLFLREEIKDARKDALKTFFPSETYLFLISLSLFNIFI